MSGRLGLPTWPELSGMAGVEADLILAGGLIAAAWGAGYAARCLIASRIAPDTVERLGIPGGIGARMSGIGGGLIALIILVAADGLVATDRLASLSMATALGLTAGYLVFQISRTVHIAAKPAALLAALMALGVLAANLGLLQPVIDALDSVTFKVGKYGFSLLGLVNGALVVAVLLILVGFLTRLSGHWITTSTRLDPSQRVLFEKLVGIAIVALALFLGIDLLGIDLTALAVFSGALGLAVGFGMQKTFGNLLSGLILLMDRSIKPGDVIVIDDTFGWVNKIGIRAVSVLTRDGKEFLIPNEKLMTEQVENWSYSSRNVRIHIAVGVSYSADLRRAQQLMLQAAKEAPRVLADPAPNIWLKDFGESSVDHEILVWIADAEEGTGNVRSAILNRLWELFKAEGIEIPFPQRDIHIRSLPPTPPPES